ncbi:MAG TPA: GNAT family N-acetyltransferase [Gemmatimonadaceae bacterium]|nr:GNAT family N-acetyltransferase [Gemmatimonadaceae bacterium]
MITHPDRLHFAIATDPAELDQVHRINYRTFVEEIPQHPANDDGTLVDRFNARSTYFICKRGERVVGMVALHEQRPFSLDAKLAGLDAHLPPGCRPCEVRLLAVAPEHRNGVVFRGLIRALARFCLSKGFDVAVISGTLRQLKLYAHLGFVPFGPVVGTAEAPYQPMYLTLDAWRREAEPIVEGGSRLRALRFTPGPVDLHPAVEAALALPSVSHREEAFLVELDRTKSLLRELTRARHAAVLSGTGTLANDVVAMQLSALGEPGLILANGEFGERLTDHATRAGLRFSVERAPWGAGFAGERLADAVARHPDARWLWMVHHETSTGVLNDLRAATALCVDRDIRLCADCVSSLGLVPVDLKDVHLATAVSGKALGSAAGLAIVFHRDEPVSSPRVPRYLDLSLYTARAVPFTLPSAPVFALRVATELTLRRRGADPLAENTAWLRERLDALGFHSLAAPDVACPGMLTLVPPTGASAQGLGDALAAMGMSLSYHSDYLRERNWIQVALMGRCPREKVSALLDAMERILGGRLDATAASPLYGLST